VRKMSKRNKAASNIVSADHKLDPVQFDSLNAKFYQGFHEELITTRLGVLCLLHETPETIERLLAGGVSWGKLQLTLDSEDKSKETLKRSAELELVALRQHAAEVLFRVFWVHARGEPCPWVALARFRKPGDLYTAVRKYLEGRLWADANHRRQFHARAVWGWGAVDEDGTIPKRLDESTDTVAQWIEAAAQFVLEAPLYNAYKHGLAVVSSDPFSMSFGSPLGQSELLTWHSGAGFKYIGRRESNGRYYWETVHEAVDFAAAAAETATFGSLLRTILRAGAFDRGVTESAPGLPVLPPEFTPEKARNPDGKTGTFVTRLQESLIYFK
jgi:hypothetical protein